MQKITNSFLLTEEEYTKLTNPDVCYTLMTKTAANRAVKKLLEYDNFVCWHDTEENEDIFCNECPVYRIFDEDICRKLCIKQKKFDWDE